MLLFSFVFSSIFYSLEGFLFGHNWLNLRHIEHLSSVKGIYSIQRSMGMLENSKKETIVFVNLHALSKTKDGHGPLIKRW